MTPLLLALLACTGAVPLADPAPEPAPRAGPAFPALTLDGEHPADCGFDPTGLGPLLAPEQSGASKPDFARHPNGVVDTTTLKDGARVRIVRSGCAHFSEQWLVSPAPDGTPLEGARSVLAALTLPEAPAVAVCLANAPADLGPDAFTTAGDWFCTIRHTEGMLELGYDFAI